MLRSHVRRLVDLSRKFLLPLTVLTVLAGFAVTVGAWFGTERVITLSSPNALEPQTTISEQRRGRRRNLSLQPEAFNFSHRVGRRFHTAEHELSTLTGTITIGSGQHDLLISRRQDQRGESLIITLNGKSLTFMWDHERGVRDASGGGADSNMRSLMERIALDSPDQFVLAQLRGASYNTVARQVRPVADDGADGYMGPVYDIVRVTEPGRKNDGASGRWRLFYINTGTGLIDKIVAEEDGAQVEAEFSEWREQNGEKIPARIRWTRQAEPLMELNVSSVSYAPAQ